ncbi:MlaD family protein [Haloechinothrix salitolerans]|uniref:MlaD family protein n=1 Tax=Haloechinothrix salitolerans TaxID=926830 RepID=A0ABW2BYV1_9PSEU
MARLKQRLPLGQIALFLVIALVSTAYVAVNAVGTDVVAPRNHYTVLMDDAGGLTPKSPVTYRGVTVGDVTDVVALPGDDGVRVELSVLADVKVPTDTEIAVAQDTPVALKHVDLRPPDDSGPYLADGATVGPKRTSRPLALEEVLINLMKLTDSIDIDDVSVIAEELSTGLAGTAPELERLADNSFALVDDLMELEPTARSLVGNGQEFLDATGSDTGRLPRIARALARISEQLRTVAPDGVELARQVPPLTERLVPLLRETQPSVSVLLANLVTPAQIVSARIPALEHGLIFIPRSFAELATIGEGNTANFEFVVTQGPVCYYDSPRRTPQQTEPKEPELTYHCPSEVPVRGATNAPRPDEARQRPVVTMADPATGRAAVPGGGSVRLGHGGGQADVLGDDSWQAIYLQGVQP